MRLLSSLLDLLQDGSLERLRLCGTRPSADDLPFRIDQELLKVPLDPLQAHETRHLLLQPVEHRRSVIAVDVYLAQNRESDAVVDLAEGLDLIVAPGVLAAELVAREAQDGEFIWVRGCD